jgi:hypothetical protein
MYDSEKHVYGVGSIDQQAPEHVQCCGHQVLKSMHVGMVDVLFVQDPKHTSGCWSILALPVQAPKWGAWHSKLQHTNWRQTFFFFFFVFSLLPIIVQLLTLTYLQISSALFSNFPEDLGTTYLRALTVDGKKKSDVRRRERKKYRTLLTERKQGVR